MLMFLDADPKNSEGNKSLVCGDLFGAFSLLLIGLVLSAVVFVGEIVCVKYVKYFQRNTRNRLF